MDNKIIDIALLDRVIKKTIRAVEESKQQIFEISEHAHREEQALFQELQEVENEVAQVIEEVDQLEVQYRISRMKLAEVSRNFKKYSEEDIRLAYDLANKKQLELFVAREREGNLRKRRDDLQLRLKNLAHTIKHAEKLATRVTVVFDFLSGNLNKIGDQLEKVQHRQMLGLKIIQAQEEERKRVAREIHDGPAQMMAHVVFRAEIAERLLEEDVEKARRELHELKDTVRSSLTEVRKIIFDLRPMVLDDLGLIPAIRKYLDHFEQRFGIACRFQLIGEEKRLSSTMEVALYRLIQEALSNVAKHSKADQVEIKLEFRSDKVAASIKDNGVGFEYNPKKLGSTNFGLVGMSERVELLEGKMDIQTARGAGTRVMFTIPMKRG